MPRNGGGIYSLPSGYKANTGELIITDQHNPPLEDIRDDLNVARPIVAGGTGATTASGARSNLSVYSQTEANAAFPKRVANTTAMKALDTAIYTVAYNAEKLKFYGWTTGDYSSQIDDEDYIAADGIDPSLGAWVFVTGGAGDMRRSNNLSDLADDETARENLGVEIGVDVQAHSAVLDMTTASFTTAQETKLSGIEALADVTDAVNVAAAGALMAADNLSAVADTQTSFSNIADTSKFNQAQTGSPWENIAVGGKTARIHRVADRIMLADAVAYTGGNTTGSAGTWLQGVGAGSSKMDYLLINAGLASVTTAYIDSTTGGSSAYAVMGASRITGKNTGSAIGGAFFGLNDGTSGGAGTNAWGVYGEGAVASLEHRVTVGAEFEITNTAGSFAGQVTPYNGFFKGMLGGIFLGCGGGVGVNTTTYHAHFGLMLAENGQVGSSSFHRGIVILDNALVRDGGVSTGRAHAIVLPPNAAIEWYEADTETLGMSMVSSVLDATHRQTLRVDNTGLTLINADNKATFWAQWVASAVNAPALIPSATGVDVFLAFTGDDANGSVSLLGKGSGGASMRDGANVRKVQVNTTGIGFFGVTPTAQKSMAAATGTATRTTFATFAGQTISASPTQAQVQAIDDHVKILSERLKAMIDDFRSYGLHA